ncbi:hypothetical protein RND81_10G142700 [Saponaria officinalis]|uniref:RING-type E3 ubiquitin transferase n=1 Tax=Saponaria officinalis TaxID=3572 RepID=A0AAW1I1X5_SAPOF
MALYTNRRLLNHLTQPTTTTDDNNRGLLHWHYTETDDKNFQIHGQTLFYLFILFSVILLATLLLLYARWFFRFRHLHTSATHHHPSHHPHAPHAPPTRVKGLDSAMIKAMPIILHQVSVVEREDEMECCICLGVFEEGDKVKVLTECFHRFHSDCVDRWLGSQPSCPLCRVNLKPPLPSPSLDILQCETVLR